MKKIRIERDIPGFISHPSKYSGLKLGRMQQGGTAEIQPELGLCIGMSEHLLLIQGLYPITYKSAMKPRLYKGCKMLSLWPWPPWCIIRDTKVKVSACFSRKKWEPDLTWLVKNISLVLSLGLFCPKSWAVSKWIKHWPGMFFSKQLLHSTQAINKTPRFKRAIS